MGDEKGVRCDHCHLAHVIGLRLLSPQRAERYGIQCDSDVTICDGCRFKHMFLQGICGFCEKHNRPRRFISAENHRAYLVQDLPLCDKICQKCYNFARKNMYHHIIYHEQYLPVACEAQRVLAETASSAADRIGSMSEANCCKQISCHRSALSDGIEQRLLQLVKKPFPRDPLTDLDEYRCHVNAVADGLFDIFFDVLEEHTATRNALRRTAILIEQWAHNLNPYHSATQWRISDLLFLAGVSIRIRRLLFKLGIGMEPSHQTSRMRRKIREHRRLLSTMLAQTERSFVLIVDDFNAHWKRDMPRKNLGKWGSADLTNVMLREVTGMFDMRTERFCNGPVIPDKLSPSAVSNFVRERWTSENVQAYYLSRRPEVAAAALFQPYRGDAECERYASANLDRTELLR